MAGYRRGDITTTSLDKPKSDRRSGATEVKRQKTDTFVNTIKKAIDAAPKKTSVVQTPAEKRLAETTANLNEVKRRVKEFDAAIERRNKSRSANKPSSQKPVVAVGKNPFTDGKGFNIFGWGDTKK